MCEFCPPGVRNKSFVAVYIGRRDAKGNDLPLMVCDTCFKFVEHLKVNPGQALPDESDDGDSDFEERLREAKEKSLFEETIRASMRQRQDQDSKKPHDTDVEEAIAASMQPTPDDILLAQAIAASLNTTANHEPWKPGDMSQESACGPEQDI